ncbi:hypothetical protein K504DRAFT_500252 [Pleomassaria siparia CBS 279.74]|uniref:Transmembrane protein n=1 Tax=Pleomassaria siparia CBS 279.74 TaxID=1314801 RepID=A0A6G1KFN5_9PLEO|nr:hypothetical protein K504DRAFT_500252 [Pleomassaria siparia CBS 279.74]
MNNFNMSPSTALSLPRFLLVVSSTILTTVDAAPVTQTWTFTTRTSTTNPHSSHTHHLFPRSAKSRKIGINLCITISILVCAGLFFFLGMRKGKSGSWFCLPSNKTNLDEKREPFTSRFSMDRIRSWRPTLRWPWQKHTGPVFELEATERVRKNRRSWLWDRVREETGRPQTAPSAQTNTLASPVVVSPITPIVRSRDQIKMARRAEREKRGEMITRVGTIRRHDLDGVDLNVYEMPSSTSRRGTVHTIHDAEKSSNPPPSPTRSFTSKPANWFLHWRFVFEQGQDEKTGHLADKPSSPTAAPRRWYSVRSVKSSKSIARNESTKKQQANLQSRWSKSTIGTTHSVYELDGQGVPDMPTSPPPAYGRLSRQEMDWHGVDFMKKMYEKRLKPATTVDE